MSATDRLVIRALSLRQPWADAVVFGGKRIENRLKWSSSSFRGRFLIHAAAGMTRREFDDAISFMHFAGIPWTPNTATMRRGGFIASARVDGVIRNEADLSAYIANTWVGEQQRAWWMGKFALVLSNVRPLPFIKATGALGFFNVDVGALLGGQEADVRTAWMSTLGLSAEVRP